MRVQAFFESERIADVNPKKEDGHSIDGLKATEIQIDATIKSGKDLKILVDYLAIIVPALINKE